MAARGTPEERFFRYVEVRRNGCWQWTGARTGDKRNYAAFQEGTRKTVRAHRWAYEHWVGPIPKGLVLDHLCRNTLCVNPEHLEPVTSGENVLRGVGFTARNKAKRRCKYGHPLVGENIIRRPSRPSHRECHKCANKRRRVTV